MRALSLVALLLGLLCAVFADTYYDDLGVGQDADEATIKKVRLCPSHAAPCLPPCSPQQRPPLPPTPRLRRPTASCP